MKLQGRLFNLELNAHRDSLAVNGVAICIVAAASYIVLITVLTSSDGAPLNSSTVLYVTAKVLFWVFALGVVLLPSKWAFLSLLLVMQVDVTAPGFVGNESVGLENAIRVLVLPSVVLWRVLPPGPRTSMWTKSARLWMVFILYAAVAGIWSPYKLAAAKMIGYLLCHLVLFAGFYWGWRRNLIDAELVSLALWGSLLLACFQSFVLGNPMDPWDGRFSSFCWPQAFGPGLVSLLAVLLFHQRRLRFRWATVAFCLAAIVLSGSRLAFVGSCSLFFSVWLQRTLKRRGELTLATLGKSVSGAMVTLIVLCAIVLYVAPTNRLSELLLLGSKEYQSATDIGTVAARFMTYEAVLSELSSRNVPRLAFGAGTSTGGEVVVNYNLSATVGFAHADYVDPNRSLNSDLFKTLYEWGLVGLLLGIALLVRLVKWVLIRSFGQRSESGFALLGILPMLLLGFGEDNFLTSAGATNAGGLVLLLAWGFAESEGKDVTTL